MRTAFGNLPRLVATLSILSIVGIWIISTYWTLAVWGKPANATGKWRVFYDSRGRENVSVNGKFLAWHCLLIDQGVIIFNNMAGREESRNSWISIGEVPLLPNLNNGFRFPHTINTSTFGQSSARFVLPLWPLVLGWLGLQGSKLRRFLNERRKVYHCHKCVYDLRGNLSGICPECGARIPPEQQAAIASAMPTTQPND
jgi:hypothetical protein